MPSFQRERRNFIEICGRAVSLGIQVSTGGNLSVRLLPDRFLVKPSGLALYDLSEAALLVVNGAGEVIEGEGKPTKEVNSHLALYAVREDAAGVVHYHSPYATAFAVCGREIPLKTVHAERILKRVPLIPEAKEGSESLALEVKKTFSDPVVHAAILAGHGVLAAGRDLLHAQNLAELLEETAKIAFLSQVLAGAPWQIR